jgi:hypothetical protein
MRWTWALSAAVMVGCATGGESANTSSSEVTFKYTCEGSALDSHGSDDHISCACPCEVELAPTVVQADPPRAGVTINVMGASGKGTIQCSWEGAPDGRAPVSFGEDGLTVSAPNGDIDCTESR